MSGEQDLVEELMGQMVKDNGDYDEEAGKFLGQEARGGGNQLSQLQEEFIRLIRGNPELTEMINSDPSNQAKINQILEHSEFLSSLMEDRNVVPSLIKDLLQPEETPQTVTRPVSPPPSGQGATKPEDQYSYDQASAPHPVRTGGPGDPGPFEEESGSSLTDLIIGPVLAAIAFFLVVNTPLLYYIGQIPYVGSFLVGNKLLTQLILVMVIYTVGSITIDLVGLI